MDNATFRDTNRLLTNYKSQPLATCDQLVVLVMKMVNSPEFQSTDHLGGYWIGLATSLTIENKDFNVVGFKPYLVAGGQNGDVIRHLFMNAGGFLSHGNMGYWIHGGMQVADHRDYNKKDKKAESIAEMRGNEAGAKLGGLINQYFHLIKYGNESDRNLANNSLESEIRSLLCN